MARMPGTTPRTASRSASNSERKGRLGRRASRAAAARRGPTAAPRRSEHSAGGDQERRAHAEHRPSIRKTIAPTHIWNVTDPVASDRNRDGTASGDERLERRPLDVDPGVEQHDRGDHAGDAEPPGPRKQRHPDRRQHESAMTIGSRPRPAALARSDAAPANGTRSRSSTLSIAITAPITVR
jgi:hypothetical protein